MSKEPTHILFVFATGQTCAFVNDEQVPKLNEPWILLWARHAQSLGYDPTLFEIQFQDHKFRKGRIDVCEDGTLNWSVEEGGGK